MKLDKCAYCSSYDPQNNYCKRNLCGIWQILSCTAAGDASTKIKKETGEVFGKKDETKPQEQYEENYWVRYLKLLRKSAMYRDHDGEFELGFFRGWVTACNAALAVLGVDPNEK